MIKNVSIKENTIKIKFQEKYFDFQLTSDYKSFLIKIYETLDIPPEDFNSLIISYINGFGINTIITNEKDYSIFYEEVKKNIINTINIVLKDDFTIDKNKIINEVEIHPGGTSNTQQFQDLLIKANEGICKISLENNSYGSGFFCKIEESEQEKNLRVLFTCNHVLNKEFLNKYKKLTMEINNKIIILDLDKRRIWTNSDLDYTCIEIFKNDNIKYFFNIDEKIIIFNYNIEDYIKKGIYIFGIMKDLHLGFDSGYIARIKDYMLFHNCNTNLGCSGGAIIEKTNNSIIGIHKGSYQNKINIGIFMKNIIADIKNNNYFKIINNDININVCNNKNKSLLPKNNKNDLNIKNINDNPILKKIIKLYLNYYNISKKMNTNKSDCSDEKYYLINKDFISNIKKDFYYDEIKKIFDKHKLYNNENNEEINI